MAEKPIRSGYCLYAAWSQTIQPVFRLMWMLESEQLQVPMFRPGDQFWIFPLPSPIGLEQPLDQGIIRPDLEVNPERLVVSVPQFLIPPPAEECPLYQLPECPRKGIVNPDHRFCKRPDQVADLVIIACHNPRFRLYCSPRALTKYLCRSLLPVWIPMQRVEFDEMEVLFGGKLLRNG